MCHNPSNTDASTRATATVAADKAAPPQGINFNLLVHRIHYGINMQAANRTYVVVGFGGSHNDFSSTLFPALSPTGAATDTENCSLCHVNSTEQNDLTLTGLNQVTDPQGPINPNQAFFLGVFRLPCGLTAEASHMLSNTTVLGEACAVCHSSGAAYAVDAGACAVLICSSVVRLLLLAAFRGACLSLPLPAGYVGSEACAGLSRRYLQRVSRRVHTTRLRPTKRRGFEGRACESCHGPAEKHAGSADAADIRDPAKLAAAAADKICLTCHLNQPTHVGRLQSSHAKDQVACTSCHKVHANGPNGLVVRKPAAVNELCASCHVNVWAQFQRPFHHKLPEGAMSCVDCHNPHGTIRPAMTQIFRRKRAGVPELPRR